MGMSRFLLTYIIEIRAGEERNQGASKKRTMGSCRDKGQGPEYTDGV